MDGKFWYLKHCPLFERLAPEEIRRLESRSRSRTFESRSPVYFPSDSAGSVMLLIAGRVKLYHLTPDGKETILAFVEPGEIFGELAVLGSGERDEYAEAMQRASLVLLPSEEVRRLMEDHSDFALGVTKLIGFRRRRIERRLKSLLFRSNRERLVSLLLELAEQHGRWGADGLEIGIRLSHQELAGVIGSTRETVTVILGQLQTEGLLTVRRRRLTIHHLERLADAIEQAPPSISEPKPSAFPLTARA